MSKVTIGKLRPAIEYLTQLLDKTDLLLMQIKISKVISELSKYFSSAAPVGLIVESYKRRYDNESRLEMKLQKLFGAEIDYEGPVFTLDEINQLPEITADDLIVIDFLIRDW